MWPALAAALLVGSGSSTPASQPSRVVFVSSRTTVSQLYSVEPSGRGLAQLTFGPGGWSAPLPSPDGRFVAAFRGNDLWLMQGDGRNARLLRAEKAWGGRSWSRDSRRLVFSSSGAIWTAAATGGPPRQITRGHDDSAPSLSPDGRSIAFLRSGTLIVRRHGRERILLYSGSGAPAWSPDGKWIAILVGPDGDLELVRPRGGAPRIVLRGCGPCTLSERSWSHDSRRLAYEDYEGIHVVERSGRGERMLARAFAYGFAWSPRGRAIAFATTSGVEIVTLDGRVRTLIPFGPYEAEPNLGWSWAPTDLAYQTPEDLPMLVRVSSGELEARFPIEQFSADGDRVAYWLCPHSLGAWRPGDERPVSLGSALLIPCLHAAGSGFGNYVYGLALAGDRLAYLTGVAANRVHTALMLTTLERGDEGTEIVQGAHDYDQRPALGDVVGGGSTLVYGTRESLVTEPQGPETIWRLDDSRPVQITFAPDDLQPLAADEGRVLARRPDGTLDLLGLDGGVLRTFDVPSLGAVLAEDDLVVLVQGELRDYSASTGDLRYVWPLADVPSSGRCRHSSCPGIRLTLDDAARGVAVYTLDGVVHLLRLSSGADVTVPGATAAELTDAGLFYAYAGEEPWPGRIRFVPFDELPL
jgi:Tol biopolymer transport system component